MANELSNKVTQSFAIGGITIGGVVDTVLGDTSSVFQKSLDIVTNLEIDIPITVALVKGMAIVADHDCVVLTNDSGEPVDTLNLKANVPLIWTENHPASMFFLGGSGHDTDITKFFVTTTVATLLKFGASYESIND